MFSVDSQGAAMGGQFVHVEDGETVAGKYPLHRQEREVRKVLVINRVEFDVPHHLKQMWKLEGDDAARFEDNSYSLGEGMEIWHMRVDVVPRQQIGRQPFGDQLSGCFLPEENL